MNQTDDIRQGANLKFSLDSTSWWWKSAVSLHKTVCSGSCHCSRLWKIQPATASLRMERSQRKQLRNGKRTVLMTSEPGSDFFPRFQL